MFISMGIWSKGFLRPIVKPTPSRKICNHTSHGGRNSTILMDPVSWVKRGGDWMALEMMRLQGQAFFGNHSEIRREKGKAEGQAYFIWG